MNDIIEKIEGEYKITEYANGTIVKSLLSTKTDIQTEQTQQTPTLEDKVNYLYYKSMGVI